MTPATTRPARTAALRAARARDSRDKRQRALAAVEALVAAGAPVTFAAVAKTAGVSSWLVYAEGVRESVDAARRRQADQGLTPAPSGIPGQHRATPDSLRTELALARAEIATLRAERDKLRQRLRLQLGAEIEGPDRAELIGRVADLEAVNRQLVAERASWAAQADVAGRRARDFEDELSAARESLRRFIRDTNRDH